MLGIRRLIANLIDFFISYTLAYYFVSQEFILKNLQNYELIPTNATLSFKHTVITFILLFGYRFYCSLIFKVSLGQAVLGLNVVGHSFFQSRLSASLRVALFPIVIIVDILDYFFRNLKKSQASKFNDLLFGSTITYRDSFYGLFFGIILLICSGLAFLYSPFLYHGPLQFNPSVNVALGEKVKITKSANFELFSEYGARSLEFSTFSDLSQGRFKINPSYELRRNSGKLIYRPIITLWDNSLGIKGLFKIAKRFDFYKLITQTKDNYPLFSQFYPNLNTALLNFNATKEESFSLNEQASVELIELMSNSLVATPFNLFYLFKKKRFNIFPYLIFKEELFKLMGNEAGQEIEFVQKGNLIFLKTFYDDDFNQNFRERFFSFNDLRPVIYEVVWQKTSYSQKVSELFDKTFFSKAKWGSEMFKEADAWEKDYIFNPISIVDFIGYTNFSIEGQRKFENYLLDFFSKQALTSFQSSKEYQNILLGSMQRLFVVWQLKIKNDNLGFSRVTIKKFSDMMRALEMRDKEFFK